MNLCFLTSLPSTASLPSLIDLIRGVIDEADANAATVTLIDTAVDDFIRERTYRAFDGVIIVMHWHAMERTVFRRLAARIPLVSTLIDSRDPNGLYVGAAEEDAVSLIVRHLCDEGYTRIGLFTLGMMEPVLARYRGFRRALDANKLPFEERWVFSDVPLYEHYHPLSGTFHRLPAVHPGWRHKDRERLFQAVIAAKSPPEAIVFTNDPVAYHFWEFASGERVRIPRDIAIAGTDGVRSYRHDRERNSLTTVKQNRYGIGRTAVRKLIETIAGKNGERKILLPPRLVIGASTSRASGSSIISERERIANFIHSEYANRDALASIAERFGMKRKYFSKRFRTLFGASITAYLTDLRLRKAAFLLEHSSDAVSAVLAGIGYFQHQRFYAHFKRRFGCTPEAFREHARNRTMPKG
ncbi:MAG: substrate-binding domain-containing protein [Spirochaetota bacterium]